MMLPSTLGGFRVILADPPWRYACFSQKGEQRSASKHYSVMALADICAMPVAASAADDAHLFLWATDPHLEHAFLVMKAWGFTYSGLAFWWLKLNRSHQVAPRLFLSDRDAFFGMGHTTRKNVEVVLLGRRGAPKRNSKGIPQVIVAPVREHSRKPDEAYQRMEAYSDGPRMELFARQSRDGWVTWGNEATKYDGAAA